MIYPVNLQFIVNGVELSLPYVPGEVLATLLRERLGLTGVKIGCNEAECGACTVIVDNQAVLSCIYPAQKVQGRSVLTIEGLNGLSGKNGELHPLQEAFVLNGAVQCGFCIPGQIMTAYALLLRNPDPTPDDIRHELKDTLCRCGGYPSIERAILEAGRKLRDGKPLTIPPLTISKRAGRVIGQPHPRPEAESKVTGKAIYTDDLHFSGMLYGRAKRAGIPHARVLTVHTEKARALPGVVTVLTADDILGEHNHGIVIPDWPILVGVGEIVRYVGDAIALVAADSFDTATQALELIEVEYEPLPVVTDPVQANQMGAIAIHPDGNMLKHIQVRKGDVDEGFRQAEVILEHTFKTISNDHAFIEPECSIARLTSDGRMEIFVGSQIPYADRNQVAQALGWSEKRVRIIGMLIGGGFGGKEDIAGQIHAALLVRTTGKPVKVRYDRHESLLVHPKRHATQIRIKVGAKKDGTLMAVETELYGDTGAYASLGEKVMTRATTHSTGPYDVPNVKADCYAMYTNNPPAGAFRGFGVTQSIFAVESMMDILAEKIKLDPVELRRKNGLRQGSLTNTGQLLSSSVGLMDCIDAVDAKMRSLVGSAPFTPREVPGFPYKRRAWGFAAAYKNTGLGGGAPDKASAEVELYSDGSVEVRTSSAELGQGLVTVLQMIAAEELVLPLDKVRVLLSDTDLTPDGGPTTASRQTYVTGNAVKGAATALREAISATLAELYDIPPERVKFIEGLAQVEDKMILLGDVANMMRQEGHAPKTAFEYYAPNTKPLGEGGDMHFAFSFAAQAAEVEVDIQTGEVKVLKIIVANDVGTALNPLGLMGQVEGGVMMGLGNALLERFIVEDGRVVTDRLARYRIPSITDMPEIISIIVEHPTAGGPYGAKGVGEISSIPTTPAITNAIYHAVGVRVDQLPVDQEIISREWAKRL